MGSEELYHYMSEQEHNNRLPKQLKNQNKINEEENYRKAPAKKIQGVARINKGREGKTTRKS